MHTDAPSWLSGLTRSGAEPLASWRLATQRPTPVLYLAGLNIRNTEGRGISLLAMRDQVRT